MDSGANVVVFKLNNFHFQSKVEPVRPRCLSVTGLHHGATLPPVHPAQRTDGVFTGVTKKRQRYLTQALWPYVASIRTFSRGSWLLVALHRLRIWF